MNKKEYCRCNNAECLFQFRARPNQFPFHCLCGWRYETISGVDRVTDPIKVREKVGSEFSRIATTLGFVPDGCNCDDVMLMMNQLGADGCEREFAVIVPRIKANAAILNWTAKILPAMRAVASGLAFRVNWTDPIPDFVSLAISRARGQVE